MPANLEQMFYVGEEPWHKSGNKFDDAPTVDAAYEQSGCDFTVSTIPLYTEDKRLAPVRGIMRDDNSEIMGSCGPRWQPYQNKTLFEWFRPMIDDELIQLHTGGSLCGGQKVWVLAKTAIDNQEVVKGDEVSSFLMVSNCHDGKTAIRVGFTPIRIVCANTLAMAHSSASSRLLRVRHTSNAETTLETIREIMNLASQEFTATVEQYQFLASRNVSMKDLRKYVKILLSVQDKDDKDLPTRTDNKINDIVDKALHGLGQDINGVRGTWWGAYNGVTEYLNYTHGRNESNRLDNLWFGQNVNVNGSALDTAVEMANSA
jgi:phage/plasmid-like protein (TIGR03299 family)